MLKCVASKLRTRLLNKLNKSSAIHPGPGGSPAHADQRRTAAACNITQWRRGPTGGRQRTEANARPERNYVGTQLQHLHKKAEHHPHVGARVGEGGGGAATLRLDILSADGTIIWEEIGESVEDARPVSTY